MSSFIPPQLLTAGSQPPTGPNWRYELKYDGYRAQVHVTVRGVRVLTRNGLDWTHRFPQLVRELLAVVRTPCVLDGEIYAPDTSGRPDFTLLCSQLNGSGRVHFGAFDVLEIDGADVLNLPLDIRRRRLAAAVPISSALVHVIQQSTEPAAMLEFARQHNWEGIVAKAADSVYRPGHRATDWRKLKLKQRQEFVIAGWRPDPQTGAIKSLVLATVDNGALTLRGSVGTGFTREQRHELPAHFTAASASCRSPYRPDFVPIQPNLVAEIEYLELSAHGILRQPTFLGLRLDKPAMCVQLDVART